MMYKRIGNLWTDNLRPDKYLGIFHTVSVHQELQVIAKTSVDDVY